MYDYYVDEAINMLEGKGYWVISWKDRAILKVIINRPKNIVKEKYQLEQLQIKAEIEGNIIYGEGVFQIIEIFEIAGYIKRNINKDAKISIQYIAEI